MRRSKGLRSTPAVTYARGSKTSSSQSSDQQQHSISNSTAVSDSNTTTITAAAAAAAPTKDIKQYAVDTALEQWRLQQDADS